MMIPSLAWDGQEPRKGTYTTPRGPEIVPPELADNELVYASECAPKTCTPKMGTRTHSTHAFLSRHTFPNRVIDSPLLHSPHWIHAPSSHFKSFLRQRRHASILFPQFQSVFLSDNLSFDC